jgi:hypothetical protein
MNQHNKLILLLSKFLWLKRLKSFQSINLKALYYFTANKILPISITAGEKMFDETDLGFRLPEGKLECAKHE